MDRRELVRASLMLGGALTITTNGGGTPVLAARKTGGKFYRGVLNGDGTNEIPWWSWKIQLTIVASRFEGFARSSDEDTPEFWIAGQVKKGRLKGFLWDIRNLNEPAGTLRARQKRQGVTGYVSLAGRPKGDFDAPLIAVDKDAMAALSGEYDAQTEEGTDVGVGFKARAIIGANGTWEVTDLRRPDGTPIKGRWAGVYLLEPKEIPELNDQNIYASRYPKPSRQSALSGRQVAAECNITDSPCCGPTNYNKLSTQPSHVSCTVEGPEANLANQELYIISPKPGGRGRDHFITARRR